MLFIWSRGNSKSLATCFLEQDQQIFTQHVQHNNTIHVVPWTICGRNSVCVAIKKSLCSFLVCASRKKRKERKTCLPGWWSKVRTKAEMCDDRNDLKVLTCPLNLLSWHVNVPFLSASLEREGGSEISTYSQNGLYLPQHDKFWLKRRFCVLFEKKTYFVWHLNSATSCVTEILLAGIPYWWVLAQSKLNTK